MIRYVLGFDFGESRIGIAVGQRFTKTASSLCTLRATNGKPNWDEIKKIVSEWNPEVFVIGLPINMDGTISEMSEKTRKFARKLNGRFNTPVHMIDERLSTVEAMSSIRLSLTTHRMKSVKKRTLPSIDSESARIILTSWLNDQ